MDFTVEVSGNLTQGVRFERELPEEFRAGLRETITQLTDELYDKVAARVPRRTGELASELAKFVDETETRITGRVKIVARDRNQLLKAIAEEYGAHGTGHVKGHTQHISTVFGRLIAPLEVTMRDYDRRANIEARLYEHDPLEEMRSEIAERLQQAITATADQA